MWEKEKDFEILEELEHYDLEDEIGDDSLRLDPVGYIYSYADRKAELTFAKSIVYVIL